MFDVLSRSSFSASAVFGPAPCASRSTIVLSVSFSVSCSFLTYAAICLSEWCPRASSDRTKSANCCTFICICACSPIAKDTTSRARRNFIFNIMTQDRLSRLRQGLELFFLIQLDRYVANREPQMELKLHR